MAKAIWTRDLITKVSQSCPLGCAIPLEMWPNLNSVKELSIQVFMPLEWSPWSKKSDTEGTLQEVPPWRALLCSFVPIPMWVFCEAPGFDKFHLHWWQTQSEGRRAWVSGRRSRKRPRSCSITPLKYSPRWSWLLLIPLSFPVLCFNWAYQTPLKDHDILARF